MTVFEQPFIYLYLSLFYTIQWNLAGDIMLIFSSVAFQRMPGITQARGPAELCNVRMLHQTVPWPCAGGWFTRATWSCPSAACQCVRIKHPGSTTWDHNGSTTRGMSTELWTLPLQADFVPNRNRVDPGVCCPPVAPFWLPVGSLPPQWQVDLACLVAGYPGRGAVGAESSSPTATPLHECGDSCDPECNTTGGGRPSDPARCFPWSDWYRLWRIQWGPWGARSEACEWGGGDLVQPAPHCILRHWLPTVPVIGLQHPLLARPVCGPHHRMELEVTQQRCRLLGEQLRRGQDPAEPPLQLFGDLEGLCSSHAMLLLPNRGRIMIYHLTRNR